MPARCCPQVRPRSASVDPLQRCAVLAPNPDRPPPEPGRRPPPDARQVLAGLAALIGVILFVLAVATLAVWWWRWIVA
jgi:fatty acid desaturase